MSFPLVQYRDTLNERSLIARFNAGRADRGIKYAAQRSYALQIIQGSERLRKCSPESIHNCMLDVAFTGLTLSPSQQLLYLIPYKTTAIGYRGLEQLAYRTGVVKLIQAALVHEGDPTFRVGVNEDGARFVVHEEARKDRGKVSHAYCVATFTTGGRHVEVMDLEQLEAVEAAASKKNKAGGAVWRGPFRGEMQKKAVIRRAWKHWPADTEGKLEHAQTVIDRVEPVVFEGEAVRIIGDRQVNTLVDLCSKHDVDTDTVARAFGVVSLELLPEKCYAEAVRMITPV